MEEIDEWLMKRKKVCPVCKGVVGEGEGEGVVGAGAGARGTGVERVAREEAGGGGSEDPTESTPLLSPNHTRIRSPLAFPLWRRFRTFRRTRITPPSPTTEDPDSP